MQYEFELFFIKSSMSEVKKTELDFAYLREFFTKPSEERWQALVKLSSDSRESVGEVLSVKENQEKFKEITNKIATEIMYAREHLKEISEQDLELPEESLIRLLNGNFNKEDVFLASLCNSFSGTLASGKILSIEKMNKLSHLDWSSSIKKLNLGSANIGIKKLREIIKSDLMEKLEALNLERNFIENNGLFEITTSETMHHLKSLNLSSNMFNDDMAVYLTESENFNKLIHLNLSFNDIGNKTIVSLTKSKIQLQSLNLKESCIDDLGLVQIANAKNMEELKELDVSMNTITNSGALALINSNHMKALKYLDLSYNKILPEMKEQLKQWAKENAVYLLI